MDAVKTLELTKIYGRKRALDSLSVEFDENRITGLIGRNGAGKTTLLKLLAGYYRPSAGAVSVFGKNPYNNLDVSRNMIYVDDAMAFPHAFSLWEIVTEMKRFYPDFDLKLAENLMSFYGLNKRQKIAGLSKGMRSVFYALLGIAARAALTILDEPTTGMDAAVRRDFYRILLKEYIEFPRTVIISSHLLGELSGILEDIVLIDGGTLVTKLAADEAEAYAVGMRGPLEAVSRLTGARRVLHRDEFASGFVYQVAEGLLSPRETEEARELGVALQAVTAEALCIYLTENGRGGIDDALKRG